MDVASASLDISISPELAVIRMLRIAVSSSGVFGSSLAPSIGRGAPGSVTSSGSAGSASCLNMSLAVSGGCFADPDKKPIPDLAQLGFTVVATRGTAAAIAARGVAVTTVNKVAEGRPHVVDIRNLGMVAAIEVEPRPGKPGARGFDVFVDCFRRGVLVRVTGDVIALSPPLIAERGHIDQIVATLDEAVRQTP